jgi:hypothetical protein
MLGHNSISNHYYLMFNLTQHHGYDLNTLEELIPFELEIYTSMLVNLLEKQKEEQKNGTTGY